MRIYPPDEYNEREDGGGGERGAERNPRTKERTTDEYEEYQEEEEEQEQEEHEEERKPTFPIRNSPPKYFQFMFPSPRKMINEIITHNLSSQTFFPFKLCCSWFEGSGEFD